MYRIKMAACLMGLSMVLVLFGGCGDDDSTNTEICNDQQDNDGDGDVDCDDSDCADHSDCQAESVCNDGTDNDGDGDVDCDDVDCDGLVCDANGQTCNGTSCECPGGATETNCTDGSDDDCDGDTDCDDADCAADAACIQGILIEDYYNEWATMYCEQLMACENLGRHFDTVQECLDYLAVEAQAEYIEEVVAAVNDGDVIYDPDTAQQCFDALAAQGCDAAEWRAPTPDVCQGVFTGTIDNTQNCYLNEECVSGWCDQSNGCPGTCETPTAESDSCADGSQCEFNMYCFDGATCQPHPGPLAEGDTCDPDNLEFCASDMYCNPNTLECVPRWGSTDTCASTAECQVGYKCDANNECVTYQVLTNVDDACDPGDGRYCDWVDGLVCLFTRISLLSRTYDTCQVAAQQGEPCCPGCTLQSVGSFSIVIGDHHPCAEGLYCVRPEEADENTCQNLQANGTLCDYSRQCVSGNCDDVTGRCAPPESFACYDERP